METQKSTTTDPVEGHVFHGMYEYALKCGDLKEWPTVLLTVIQVEKKGDRVIGTGRYTLPFGDGLVQQRVGISNAEQRAIGVVYVENWAFKEDFDQFTEKLRAEEEKKRDEELKRLNAFALNRETE